MKWTKHLYLYYHTSEIVSLIVSYIRWIDCEERSKVNNEVKTDDRDRNKN